MNIHLFSFLFFILCAGSLYAQAPGIVKGIVKDASDKEAIIGASIYDPKDKAHGTASDINGNYLLHTSPGKHIIVCSYVGMQSDSFVVMVDSIHPVIHDFILEPAATQLQTMVVSAGKYERKLEEITVSMEVMKSALIENKNSANVKSVLEQAPGLNILDGEPQIRGGSGFNFGIGSRVAILIDGLPALAGDGGRPEWNFIPLENVEQIEIIKGASSVTYGSSALSGSINVRTTYPKDKSLTKISASSGIYDAPSIDSTKWWKGIANFSNASFFHSQKFGQFDLVVGGMGIYDHGFIGPPFPYSQKHHSWSKDTAIKDDDVGEKTARFNFNLRYRPKKIPHLNYGLNGNFMRSTNNLSLIWDNDSTGVHHSGIYASGLYRAYPYTMTLQDQTILYIDPFINYYTDKEYKYSLRTRYFYTKNSLTDSSANESHVAYSEYQFTKPLKEWFNITGGVIMNQTYSNSGMEFNGVEPENHLRNFAGYTQLDMKVRKVLNLSVGSRVESFIMNNEKAISHPIFRSGLNLKLAEATFARYSYGQGYRFPTITEKYMYSDIGGLPIFPNPELEAETSWNTEVGLKQGFKINKFIGYLDVALFWQEFKNTIEFTYGVWDKNKDIFGDDSLSVGFRYLNTGRTRVRGFEISLPGEGKISRNVKLNVLFGYTYVLPQAVNPGYVFAIDSLQYPMSYDSTSTDRTDNVLKYRFQHLPKIDVQTTYKAFFIGGSCRYYSFIQNIDRVFYLFDPVANYGIITYREENNKGITIVDARVGMNITKNLTVSFIVNNVFNKSYSLRPLKIESPRTFAMRLSYDFGAE